ncbi:MAG: sigma-54-dependent Fis family transcriptional regulator [Flexistipes sinusarabici]|uniref:Sigma-54-dependent Fis family transcriptional regulator n=1 Tax=Flexistipes sinusarabici TaxID=2352 RepID=A0A5D0MPL9_FLESI|nr:sigma-54 dependent transcriptional regulator [Flexistipes sinusarabici]TYB33480.1 MAG: sigma-54-dependent Fis family transcriptional regulator [Flexistipes sinusarabici]
MQTKIFVVDDERYTLDFFEALLINEDVQVFKYRSPIEAFKAVEKNEPDLIISDIVMPEMSGLEFLEELNNKYPYITVILITAYASIEKAVQAIKKGAFDFLTKPFDDIEEVTIKIKKGLENSRLKNRVKVLQENVNELYGIDNIVSKSKKMNDILSMVKKVSGISSNILISGESGTGKELIARSIHQLSSRKDERFLPINCAAIPENLQESLFFGYEKGAFTGADSLHRGYFEEADGGTLFLDEIGETDPNFQVKLLRVIQEKSVKRLGASKSLDVDVRLICATNKNLEREVEAGNFRQDLYYRINVIKIEIPPLRERAEDVPYLVDFFIKRYNREFSKNLKGADSGFMKHLYEYDWPGNVRELENIIERSTALAEKDYLSVDNLPETFFSNSNSGERFSGNSLKYKDAREEFEKSYLKRLLELSDNNITRASKLAEVDPATMHRKVNKYLKE